MTVRMRISVLLVLLSAGTATATENFIVMVPMRDEVALRTRIFLPDGDGPWPTLLTRTPYNDGDLQWSPLKDFWQSGYALVVNQARGRFGSEGNDDLLMINDGWGALQDGYDLVEWVREQPWCNGDIGAFGGSSRAGLCNMLGGSGPPGIRAEAVLGAMSDLYRGVLYEGGAWQRNETVQWFSQFGTDPIAQVLAHPTYDDFWKQFDLHSRQDRRNHPVFMEASWYDVYFRNTIDNFTSLQRDGGPVAKSESKLIIRMWGHIPTGGWPGMHWPISGRFTPEEYSLERFMDYALGGVDNGYDELPNVAYFMPGDFETPGFGDEWRYAETWPPPSTPVPVYFRENGALSLVAPSADPVALSYDYDPRDPVLTIGGNVHYNVNGQGPGSFDQQPVEASRADVLLFTTPPLPTDVEVAGPPVMHIWASSDAVDTDFTAKLTDVYPDGRSIIIQDSIIRASRRDSIEFPTPLIPGEIYPFTIRLWDTGKFFKAGHRIRVAISSSNYPRFDINPNTGAGPALEHETTVVARNTVYFDADRPSRLVLPVVGPDTDDNDIPDYVDFAGDGEAGLHHADWVDDYRIDLSELLRVIQFFNSDGFSCANPPESSEDGYQAGPGDTTCDYHDADYSPRDWHIDLSETLRVVQFFNSGGYFWCPAEDPPTEDGFCPSAS